MDLTKWEIKERTQEAAILLVMVVGMAAAGGMMATAFARQSLQIDGYTPKQRLPSSEPKKKSQSRMKKAVASVQKEWKDQDAIVIAVIDTGVDFNHPDLANTRWENPGETGIDAQGRDKRTNGIDDDGNGYIDDVSGWDFVSKSAAIKDVHGHGTHIAGIIAGQGLKVRGFAPEAKIMALRYYDPKIDGLSAMRYSVQAMRYAIENGADIINYSGGGGIPSEEEKKVMALANQRGVLVVAAAGNEGENSERHPFYPANYRFPNILSVTATDIQSRLLPTSNFGKTSVMIAAQGNRIYSTLPGGRYGEMTGTSQATAIVSGVAGLIKAQNRNLGPERLIEQIVSSSEVDAGIRGKTLLGSKLEMKRALTMRSMASKEASSEAQNLKAQLEKQLFQTESLAGLN